MRNDHCEASASFYQQEASVPPDAYETWVQRIVGSKERVLSARSLRVLARQLSESDGRDHPPVPFAKAASRIRRLVAKLWQQMGADDRACLPQFLKSLSTEYEGGNDDG